MTIQVQAAYEPNVQVVVGPNALYRGAQRTIRVEATENRSPYDLSAATAAHFTLRAGVADDFPVLVSKTLGAGVTVAANKIDVALDVADTLGLTTEPHVWDLWVTLGGKTWPLVPPTPIGVRSGAYVPAAP